MGLEINALGIVCQLVLMIGHGVSSGSASSILMHYNAILDHV